MEKIEKLETAVGKKVEQWNVSDLQKFSLEENADAAALLAEPAVVGECLVRSKGNKEVADVLMPLTIQAMYKQGFDDANSILEEAVKGIDDDVIKNGEIGDVLSGLGEDDKNALADKCEKLAEKGTAYQKAAAYVLMITALPDRDVRTHELDIKKAANDIKESICALAVTNLVGCYSLIFRLEELLFPLRAKYFAKYQDDIIDDSDGHFDKALNAIHAYEHSVQDAFDEYVANAVKEKEGGQ